MPTTAVTLEDGFTLQDGGMNNGLDPSTLGPRQFNLLINGTARGGYVTQRPGMRRVMQVRGAGSLFQHMGWLRTRSGQVFLVVVADGRFFRVDPRQKTVFDFTIPGDANPSNVVQGFSIPGGAEGFWVYQDGQTTPLIWDGASVRRAKTGEIKVGTVMAYVQGRIWYARPDEISFRATDLVGNRESGTPAYRWKDAILKETENTFLNEGGDFAVPANSGGIRAMAATAMLDTSQGQGPLQVFCEKTAFSVNTPVDRAVWKSVTYPIITTSLISAGATSSQGTIHVNGDIFMRAPDGIRSFIVARRVFRDWGNTPQSFEISNILRYDQTDLLRYSSAAVFDNRMLMTLSPAWSNSGVYHRGFAVMDLSPVSSLLAQGTPIYEGIWTGFKVLSVQQTDIGTFFLVLCEDGSFDLWELSKEDLYDDETGRISWSLTPRKMFVERDAGGRPQWTMKRLLDSDLYYDLLAGSVSFSVHWRPDAYPCWNQWRAWNECAPACSQDLECDLDGVYQYQYRPHFRLGEPPDICVTGIQDPLRAFFEVSTRIDVCGPARLRAFRVVAAKDAEPVYEPTCDTSQCVPILCCPFNPFSYVAKGTAGDTPGYHYGGGGGGEGDGSCGSVSGTNGTNVT